MARKQLGTSASISVDAPTKGYNDSGLATLSSKTLANPTFTDYTEGVVSIGTVATAYTIDLTNGTVQIATLTASTGCAFTMPPVTGGKSFTMLVKQDPNTGGGSATFSAVKWNGAGAPTITQTPNALDAFAFVSDGVNWYGTSVQGYNPPIIFDAVGAGTYGQFAAPSSSFTHVISSGASVLLWIDYAFTASGGAGTISATVGGTPMTLLSNQSYATVSGYTYGLACYGLVGAPSGTQTVTFYHSVTYGVGMNSVSYFNVGSFGTPTYATGSGTSASMAASSAGGRMIGQAFTNTSASGTTIGSYNQTSRYSQASVSASNAPVLVGDAPGASSVSFSASWSSSYSWLGMAVDIIPT